MAITNAGTQNLIHKNQLPTGYTRPVVTTFTDDEYTSSDLTLTIAKSTVENADKAVTMAAIVSAITTQIDGILAADYVATQTVTAFTDLLALTNNHSNISGIGDWLDTSVVNYTCSVVLYVKTA